jgi:serine/threonine-protein kinase PknG
MEAERGGSPEAWQVRLHSARDVVLGAGVLLGGRFVLTCAHVLPDAHEPLTVDFMNGADRAPAAPVAVRQRATDDSGDLALLELAEPVAPGRTAGLARFTEWYRSTVPDVQVFGHLAAHRHGQHARLRLLGLGGQRREWVEMQPLEGSTIQRGFSGGGVVCSRTRLVLGVITEKDRADTRAWMIPVSRIVEALPQVLSWVVEYPPIDPLLQHLDDEFAKTAARGRYSHRDQYVLVGKRFLATGLKSWRPRDLVEVADVERIVRSVLRRYDRAPSGGEVADEPAPSADEIPQPCAYDGCPGRIEETGFCDTCDRLPGPAHQARRAVRVVDGSWECAGLVNMPTLSFSGPDQQPESTSHDDAGWRTCQSCEAELARAVARQTPPTTGYCPRCRERFSFAPQLRNGTVIGGKYEIERYLGRGGFGSIYLAKDTHLPDGSPRVVVKALINQPEGESVIHAEHHHLMTLKNEKLVRALDFVHHEDETGARHGYIVMEYIDGVTLDELEALAEPLPSEPGGDPPPRIVEILAYGCEILDVFEYLHGRGLLYTDMSPTNVMRGANGIHIIDLGSVRQQGDRVSHPVLKREFGVPDEEVRSGLSVGSDLYAVARTLQELQAKVPRHEVGARFQLSIDSFDRVLQRALRTGEERDLRFASAAEFSEQLGGVLREILSLHDREPRSRPSIYFTSATELQDDGLGLAPALETWTDGAPDLVDLGRPRPHQFVRNLPPPIIDPNDRHAARLAVFSGNDPEELDRYRSVEARLLQCRKLLERTDPAGARRYAEEARRLGGLAVRWRIDWHLGLIALRESEFTEALTRFEAVHEMLPAEATPKIAIGYCLENLDDRYEAFRYYAPPWRRDAGPASTAFGMARLRLAEGKRHAAVQGLDEVRKISKHYGRAQVAATRACLLKLDSGEPPTCVDFGAAVKHLENLRNDDSHRLPDDEFARLLAWVREQAFEWLDTSGTALPDGGDVLGRTPTREGLRALLEQSFHELAHQAGTRRGHDVLLDLKNHYRPLSRW